MSASIWTGCASNTDSSSFVYLSNFGAFGDGFTDDYQAVYNFIAYLLVTGRQGIVGPGTYLLSAPIIFTGGGTKGLKIKGAGMGVSIFKRNNFPSGTMRFRDIDGILFEDFTIDGNRSVSGGTVGLDITNTNNSCLRRIEARNIGASYGMWMISGVNAITQENNHIINCAVRNSGGAGMQIQGARHSSIQGCFVDTTGLDLPGEGTGIALKVPIEYSLVSDCTVRNGTTSVGFSVGSSFPGTQGKYLAWNNILIENYATAFRVGEVEDSVANNIVYVGSQEATTGLGDCIRLENGATRNSIRNVSCTKVKTGRAAARVLDGAVGNNIHFSSIQDTPTGAFYATFSATATNNHVECEKSPEAKPDGTSGISDAGTGNSFIVKNQPVVMINEGIVSGVITLDSPMVAYVQVDTEGEAASDTLTTINGGEVGQVLVITSREDNRDITVQHGTGNIYLAGGVDFTLDRVRDTLTLMYLTRPGSVDLVEQWVEIARSNNHT